MNRRDFVTSAATAGMAAVPASAAPGSSIFEMRWFRLRNGSQVQRTGDFLSKYYLPAARRAGIGPLGFFSSLIADQGPFVLVLAGYPSFQAVLDSADRMAEDKEFQGGYDEYNSASDLSYIRMESSLLRAFDVQRSIAVPEAGKSSHIFELRVYESNNARAGKTKIRMFNQGEAAIFQRLGMAPVFFAETVAGRNMPNLTYMVTFSDLADREAKWKAFGSDPEWLKMRSIPEYADALIVSNISNAILRPLPFSPIR